MTNNQAIRVALASAQTESLSDTDLPILLAAASDFKIDAQVVHWDDPDVDWAAWDLVAVRSCWDYHLRRDEFLAWARERGSQLVNPPAVIAWNSDKRYLAQLEDAGVPIIPTLWDVDSEEGLPVGDSWVVKPTISAGAANTAHWTTRAAAVKHSRELLAAGHATMAQPYVEAIDTEGETAVFWFGGNCSHAVRKAALLAPDRSPELEAAFPKRLDRVELTDELRRTADQAVAEAEKITGEQITQARVDVVRDSDGALMLMELELIEPSLFLPHAPEGAQNWWTAIQQRA